MSILGNHRGGVVRVKRPPGQSFSVVPRPLLLDLRLSLAARAVASYLVGQDVTWQIAVAPMCAALGLSKDRWQSLARELETAGYLKRSREKGDRGEWVWNIIFDHARGLAQAEAAAAGLPMAGFPSHGSSSDGEPSHKEEEKRNTKIRESKDEHQNGKTDTAFAAPRGVQK